MRGSAPDSAYSWLRLTAAVALCTIGGVGMWSVVVVLPAVQAEFGVGRAEASLPFTLRACEAFGDCDFLDDGGMAVSAREHRTVAM